jgi:putative intracellular protease/amidase
MPSLLVALSGADHWTLKDGTRHPTGFWAEEFVNPIGVFRAAGQDVTLATPGGVRPTVDQRSLDPAMTGGEQETARLRQELDSYSKLLAAPTALEQVTPEDYDGVFVPGGHGPMEDLAVSSDMARIVLAMLDSGRLVSAVCHGPAGLLPAQRPDGTWALAGRTISCFTDEEEEQAGLADKAPWLLEDRIRQLGGQVQKGPAWQPFSVVDGNLVTGQNPASSTETAHKVVTSLGAGQLRG